MENFTRRFGMVFLSLVIAGCWAWAGFSAVQFSLITTIIALGLSLTCFWLIRTLMASKNVVARASFDSAGTLILPDIRITKSMHRFVATGTVSAGLMFAAWLTGVLYLPLGEFGHVLPILMGAGAGVLAWLWFRDSTDRGLSYLMLTPDGFEFAGIAASKSGKWDDVVSVADKLPNEERFWNPMVITMKGGKVLAMEAPATYTPKGTALIDMVRFYWQHPEHRDEITDGRALQHLTIPQSNQRES
ncbi:hypothetical protein H7J71_29360 [Mycolicibacterium peregrinum]|uniref:hypothetical protein n=1 Tax=Mycolicibacterium peregrinum TaxID=43304 RepID=UPI0006D82D90|nr:hypothetical protein [Mycolicibacterium peregrinum]MCV7206118.1 hypothetical protein [Mycolicibacterium peregrinum]ORW57110.1 hypothetical protein AWC21_19440 [Mycolicibacterium peregrinum]